MRSAFTERINAFSSPLRSASALNRFLIPDPQRWGCPGRVNFLLPQSKQAQKDNTPNDCPAGAGGGFRVSGRAVMGGFYRFSEEIPCALTGWGIVEFLGSDSTE